MSLEDKIDALTAAIEANTKALTGGAGTKSTGTKSTGTKSTGTKGKSSSGANGVTVDQVAEAFGGYLNSGSAAAKKKAKLVVKGIVENFDAERITKIDPEQFKEAMELLAQYKDGEDPLDLFDSDEDDDDGMV